MDGVKLRHELKHSIDYGDYLALHNRLAFIMKRDPNVGLDGTYKIRSLYFDNLYNKALQEKIDGVNNREKFRIRYYNDNFDFISLEKKSKINGLCRKESVRVTKEQCEKLIQGDLEWMQDSKEPLILELYRKMISQILRPKTIVDYIREPYIYRPGNVRITIDSMIQTGILSNDLFNETLPTVGVGNETIRILEVKFDDFLPEIIKDIIQLRDRRQASFSKYAACRIYG